MLILQKLSSVRCGKHLVVSQLCPSIYKGFQKFDNSFPFNATTVWYKLSVEISAYCSLNLFKQKLMNCHFLKEN